MVENPDYICACTRTDRDAGTPVWPLPQLNGQRPVLLAVDPADPCVDLAYECDDRSGHAGGYFVPSLLPVYAVYAGHIVYAARRDDGCALIVDHGDWMTYYARLRHMFAMPTDRRPGHRASLVNTGDMLGLAGSDFGPLRAVRFELWKRTEDDHYTAVDPIRFMRGWDVLAWHDRRFGASEPPDKPAVHVT